MLKYTTRKQFAEEIKQDQKEKENMRDPGKKKPKMFKGMQEALKKIK